MANSTIDDSKIYLVDRWPGVVDRNIFGGGAPPDGFTGSSHHNVATPAYQVGKKVAVYDETNKGIAILAYLQYIAGTKAATLALAARQFLAMDTSEQATAATSPTYFKLSDDASEALIQGPLAVALSAMTTTYYGWFWVGGVCPVSFVAALNDTYVTDGTVAAGCGFCGAANASLTSTQSDKIILTHSLVGTVHSASIADKQICGIALIADA